MVARSGAGISSKSVLTYYGSDLDHGAFREGKSAVPRLNRRLDLPYERRVETARNIADRIGARLNVPAENRMSPESYLEELSLRYRVRLVFR
jgi:hypothetical protein